jgi:hypothetical protein
MVAAPTARTDAVTPEDIWKALRANGASAIQAAAIMGNMISESSLNVETGYGGNTIDSNGYPVYGLVSWNAESYPSAASLVTGQPQQDLDAQVKFLAQTGGFKAASGSTVTEAAGNFAANYERCALCGGAGSSGTSQKTARQAQANEVAGWAQSGNWPEAADQATTSAQLGASAQQEASQDCAWHVDWGGVFGIGSFNACIISKTQLRALLGGSLLVGGTVLAVSGVILLLLRSDTIKRGGATMTAMAGPAGLIAGSIENVAIQKEQQKKASEKAAADKAKAEEAQERHTARQYQRQRGARERLDRDNARELEAAPF